MHGRIRLLIAGLALLVAGVIAVGPVSLASACVAAPYSQGLAVTDHISSSSLHDEPVIPRSSDPCDSAESTGELSAVPPALLGPQDGVLEAMFAIPGLTHARMLTTVDAICAPNLARAVSPPPR